MTYNTIELERLINQFPNETKKLVSDWQIFQEQNPTLSFKTEEEFKVWTRQNSEKHIDTNIWIGKEIIDAKLNPIRQQETPGVQTKENEKKEQEKHTEKLRETPREQAGDAEKKEEKPRIKQQVEKTTPQPTTAYQPRTQMPTRRLINRIIDRGGNIGRGSTRLGGRLASRLTSRVGMMVGRAITQGIAAGAAAIGVAGWIVIAVIVAIILIVFIIIFFAEGGNTVPTYECLDINGNRILVTDGNACAQNYADFYTNQTGAMPPITARCLDKCTDPFLIGLVCDRNPAGNLCNSLPASCGAEEHWCFEYSIAAPRNANNRSTFRHDCSNTDGFDYGGLLGFTVTSCNVIVSTPNPTPTLTQTP